MKRRNIVRPNALKGKDKLNRMKELMGGTSSINENVNRYVVELTKMGPDGKVYGIVRENQEYYIKVTDKTKNIVAEDFQYMGGLMNKKSKSFPSYAKAIKNLNLKFMSIKESIGESGQVNIFENDNLLKEHHPLKADMKLSDTKGIGDGQEYVVNKKGSKLSYDNKEGKEKDGFGDNVAEKDSMDELEDVKLNEAESFIDEILGEKYMEEVLDPVGKEDDDIDNDGDVDDSDEYLKHRRDVISKAIEKEKKVSESKKKSKVDIDSVLKEMRFDEKSTGLFEDEEEGYNLEEEKYVVKVDAPEKEEDIFGGDDSLDSLDDMGDDEPVSDEKPFDDEPFDAGVEADEDEDPEKFIQQLAGKIGTSLRSYTNERGEPDFDLEKYVVNSVISATHTSEMDEEDQKDIIKKVKMAGAGSDVDVKDVEVDGDEKPEEEEVDIDVEMDGSEDELNEGKFSDLFKARAEMYKKDPKMAEAMDFISMHGNKISQLYDKVKGFDLIDFAFFIYFNAKDLVFDPRMNEVEKELHESADVFKHLALKKKDK